MARLTCTGRPRSRVVMARLPGCWRVRPPVVALLVRSPMRSSLRSGGSCAGSAARSSLRSGGFAPLRYALLSPFGLGAGAPSPLSASRGGRGPSPGCSSPLPHQSHRCGEYAAPSGARSTQPNQHPALCLTKG